MRERIGRGDRQGMRKEWEFLHSHLALRCTCWLTCGLTCGQLHGTCDCTSPEGNGSQHDGCGSVDTEEKGGSR